MQFLSPRWKLHAMEVALMIYALVTLGLSFTQIGKTFPGFHVYPGMVVAWQLPATWNGPKAGLRPMDHLVSVDGQTLTTSPDLLRHVAASPAGSVHTYEFLRSSAPGSGERFTVKIASQTYTPYDWLTSFFLRWFVGLSFFAIAVWVLHLTPRDRAARMHAGLCISLGALNTGSFDATNTHVLLGHWTFYPLLVTMGAYGWRLSLLLPPPKRPEWTPMLDRFGVGLSVLVALFCLVFQFHSAYASLVATLAHIWSILGTWLLLMAILWRGFRPSSPPSQRHYATIILFGGLLACVPVPLTMFASFAGYAVPAAGVQELGLIFFPLCISYAVVRHKLFDAEVVIRKSLAYSLLALVLLLVYLVLIGGARAVVGTANDNFLNLVATAVIALLFAPLRTVLQSWLDKRFFRAPYDFKALLASFTARAQEETDPVKLEAAFLEHVGTAFSPRYAALYLLGAEGELSRVGAIDLDESREPELFRRAEAFLASDVGDLQGEESGELILRLAAGDSVLGVLLLGEKRSELAYTRQDRELLVLFGRQFAVSHRLLTRIEEERRQREALEALKTAKAMQDQFLNMVSHELRMPLSNILGSLSFLERFGDFEPRQRNHMDRIQRNALTLQGLVNDLLNAAQLRAGQFSIRAEQLSLDRVVTDVLHDLAPTAAARRVALKAEHAPDLPQVWGDRQRLAQVVRNLVHNAIRHTPEDGVVEVHVFPDAAGVRCEVRDSGEGIPPEIQASLFQPFWRPKDSPDGGVGLGLFIAMGLIEAHGGRIGVDSEVGKGSCFHFVLPLSAATANRSQRPPSGEPQPSS